jgi:4-diphosphocytidyl-2-C-methyl-D-erythritol kinase
MGTSGSVSIMNDAQLAHAKLTVHLHVTGVRSDGYHLIDAEMVSLDLADRLEFSDGDGLFVDGPESSGVPVDDRNLVHKALRIAERNARVRITKNIPAGGGLGGGSSDAAAALRWAECMDVATAAQIGADVPFCLFGGRARVQGIGDVLTSLTPVERTYTLLLPPFGVNTAAVYRAYDQLDERANDAQNDLERAAIVVEPRLVQWRDKFAELTGCQPVLAGSGSTWFVEGAFAEPSHDELGDARWIVTRTIPAIPLTE